MSNNLIHSPPAKFLYLKATLGAVEVWEQLELTLKAQGSPYYPQIYAQRAKTQFNFDKTMEFIDMMKPIWSQIDPNIDLSRATVLTVWGISLEVDV
jgi:hypothetical protein